MTLENIQSKLDMLRENLERLEQIPQASFEEFAGDFRNVDSAQHRLQTSIQALINVGSFLLALLGLPAPRTSREILERLEEGGHVPPGTVERFGPIFGFRNRIVHLYDRVDSRIVYRILRENRTDLADLMTVMLDVAARATEGS